MCGLFGYIHSQKIAHEPIFKALEQRGPDHAGEFNHTFHWKGKNAHLGLLHTRLSIIDLSAQGHQPMASPEGRYIIVFNGEIYNFQELKKELQEKEGMQFHTHSDTEVLLLAYMAWGKKFLSRLHGIFSFAIWDQVEEELFLCRDHFGVKPLYYYQGNQTFLFSSEISAVLESGLMGRTRPGRDGLHSFLSFGSVYGPSTMVENLYSLLPGHYAIWSKNKFSLHRYWGLGESSLVESGKSGNDLSYDEALEGLRHHLQRSVEWQMRADVPVGVFLSGGMDSGMLVALAGQYTSLPLQTFSIGFSSEGREMDETTLAKVTADKYGCDHHEIIITGEDFAEGISDFVGAIDQPSVDGLNSYFISKSIGKKLKVVLSGLGGDEIFAGYPVFRDAARAKNLSLPRWSRKMWKKLPQRLIQKFHLQHLSFDTENPWQDLLSYRVLDPRFYSQDLWPETPLYRKEHLDLTQKITYFETSSYMGNTLLRDMDAVSMHHSLEVRVPFLDHQLADYVFSLPQKYKFSPKQNKPLLAEAFPGFLPQEILTAPKRGFQMPIGTWIHQTLRQEIPSLAPFFRSLGISTAPLQQAILRFQEKPERYLPLWKYLILKFWLESKWGQM